VTAVDFGVGLVWWPALDSLCRAGEGLVDVIEVEPEAFWRPTPSGFRSDAAGAVAHLAQPKLLHGVGAALGGVCPPPPGHAAAFAREIALLAPSFVSGHLSVTHYRPQPGAVPAFAGFMLPPLQSAAGAMQAAANIRAQRAALGGVPLAVETPVSYLQPAPGEWADGAFLAAVLETADCGLLLDLHNLLCNARNGRQPVTDACRQIPLARVWELHLAGGERQRGFYLDAHSGVACPELMALAAWLVPQLPNLRAIVFEIQPERVGEVGLAPVARQLGALRDLWQTRGRDAAPTESPRPLPDGGPPIDPETWERWLGLTIAERPAPALDPALAAWAEACVPSVGLYRMLAGEARASAVAVGAPATTRALLRERGGPAARALLAEFWRGQAPGHMVIDEAQAFLAYLAARPDAGPALVAAVAADRAALSER
jgi:uncharacterized protein